MISDRNLLTRFTLIYMRRVYGKMSITNLALCNPTTCVYLFVVGKSNEHPVVITQFFILNGLGLFMNFQAYELHIYYVWTFSNCTAVTIMFQKVKLFICVDYDTPAFVRGD